MTTVLLEMALKEQVERLGPESIESLPEGLRGREIDPFGVVKVGYPLASTLYLPGVLSEQTSDMGRWLYSVIAWITISKWETALYPSIRYARSISRDGRYPVIVLDDLS